VADEELATPTAEAETEAGEVRLNLGLANYGANASVEGLLEAAAAADAAGIDALTLVDHVVLGGDLTQYPYGSFPGGSDAPWFEPLTTLAAMAAMTRRIRLMTAVVIAPLRGAAVLAKTAATLDALSHGRLDLGVGVGWLPKEYEAAGLPFSERGRLLDDVLAVCQVLWSGGTSFRSERLAFDDVWCRPLPVQPGGVPVWVSGELHSRNVERLVRYASGWIPSPDAKLDAVAADISRLNEALSAAGREPASVRVRVSLPVVRDEDRRPLLDQSFSLVPRLLEVGATDVHTPLAVWCRDASSSEDWCLRLATAWRESAQ
jgi:probable F420-dependent oxidoreductase